MSSERHLWFRIIKNIHYASLLYSILNLHLNAALTCLKNVFWLFLILKRAHLNLPSSDDDIPSLRWSL